VIYLSVGAPAWKKQSHQCGFENSTEFILLLTVILVELTELLFYCRPNSASWFCRFWWFKYQCNLLFSHRATYSALLASSKAIYGPPRLAGIQPVDHFVPMSKLYSLFCNAISCQGAVAQIGNLWSLMYILPQSINWSRTTGNSLISHLEPLRAETVDRCVY